MLRSALVAISGLSFAVPVSAQPARAEDVSSPEAIVRAAYGVVSPAPGAPYQWDRGFAESQVSGMTEQFGDVAHVFSTYEKHIWNDKNVLGRGINSFQLVKKDGRWWITSLAWDEETGAGPVPARYLPGP